MAVFIRIWRRVFQGLTRIPSAGGVAAFGRRGGSVEPATTHPSAYATAVAVALAPPGRGFTQKSQPPHIRLSILHLLRNPPFDAGQYPWHFLLHHPIVESNETNAKAFQSALSVNIPLTLQAVAIPIDLNRQHQLWTIEVNDVFANRSLPMKIVAQHCSILYPIPQQYLSQSASIAKLARQRLKFGIVRNDFATTHTLQSNSDSESSIPS